ncbi:hypothetical protein [Geomonas anaerohicana]|uniref:Uncharacterized protein n=1 Tax=Geomonas anaerohicana TaxID=2798583 RepID=A0ABS0YGN5_9BACT|nr:hypothetical protein [Geomonas anaerohicana]MBJ6751493.1 hypothetical protein [Geomonas anaerohicana]
MEKIYKKDPGSFFVMVITLVLFIGAVFTKGFTHDLLLEAGVFLVSVKLIIMNYKSTVTANAIQGQLKEIKELLEQQREI